MNKIFVIGLSVYSVSIYDPTIDLERTFYSVQAELLCLLELFCSLGVCQLGRVSLNTQEGRQGRLERLSHAQTSCGGGMPVATASAPLKFCTQSGNFLRPGVSEHSLRGDEGSSIAFMYVGLQRPRADRGFSLQVIGNPPDLNTEGRETSDFYHIIAEKKHTH